MRFSLKTLLLLPSAYLLHEASAYLELSIPRHLAPRLFDPSVNVFGGNPSGGNAEGDRSKGFHVRER